MHDGSRPGEGLARVTDATTARRVKLVRGALGYTPGARLWELGGLLR